MDQFKNATHKAVSNMDENSRADFGKMLTERMGGVGRSGSNAGAAEGNVDAITGMLGGIFGIFGSKAGKAALGGIAAMVLGQIMDRKN